MRDSRYAPEPTNKRMAEAIKWSKDHTSDGHISNTAANNEAAQARKNYEDNYELAFGKKDIPHGT